MEFDLHLHTSEGSACSRMALLELIRAAKEQGLDGICLTDHDYFWDRRFLEGLSRKHGLLIFEGVELSTPLGEILIYGADESLLKLQNNPVKLRSRVQELGGVMVAAHPLRRDFSLPHGLSREECGLEPLVPERLAQREVFRFVDALEVFNGRSGAGEKEMAVQVAALLQKPGTGGSDAHSTLGVGGCVTRFDREIRSYEEFVSELRRGNYRAAKRSLKNRDAWAH